MNLCTSQWSKRIVRTASNRCHSRLLEAINFYGRVKLRVHRSGVEEICRSHDLAAVKSTCNTCALPRAMLPRNLLPLSRKTRWYLGNEQRESERTVMSRFLSRIYRLSRIYADLNSLEWNPWNLESRTGNRVVCHWIFRGIRINRKPPR